MNPNVKRMLSIHAPDPYYAVQKVNKTIYINASSASVIQECMRKAHYLLERDLRSSSDESEAQTFGSAIHAGLAKLYSNPPGRRVLSDVLDAFSTYENRLVQAEGTKRSASNGRKILEEYFKVYQEDPWIGYIDSSGPFVERAFEVQFGETAGHQVIVFGTVDAVLKNVQTGELVVCDHKTTSTLGSNFYQQVKPRLQFALYAWAMRASGLPIRSVMMNGIQVAKTKQEFARVFADYGADEDAELRMTIYDVVNRYLTAVATHTWPMSTSNCAQWGGCQYHEICSARKSEREFVIQSKYGSIHGQN